jgi:hypothetical protein
MPVLLLLVVVTPLEITGEEGRGGEGGADGGAEGGNVVG